MKRLLLGLSFAIMANLPVLAQYSHYLFAYFNNNTTLGQQVFYAVSDDGVNFTPLNE